MSDKCAFIPGQALLSTIETMSALGPIGQQVLSEYGISKINPEKNYSFELRREIHDAALNRFGEISIYAFGLNNFWSYPDFIKKQEKYLEQFDGVLNINHIKTASKALDSFLDKVISDIDYGFKNGVKNGSGDYGAEIKKLDENQKYEISVTSTSATRHEAFMRGTLDMMVLTHLSRAWAGDIIFMSNTSREGRDWAQVTYSIQLKLRKIPGNSYQSALKQRDVDNKLLGVVLTESDRQKRQIQEISNHLGKYVPPQIHEALLNRKYDTKITTKRRKLSIFFSDIVGFTPTAESLQPEDLTKYLNDYFSEMTKVAISKGATIDKYIGDAMMVFFGDPESAGEQDDARNCLEMALEMQESMLGMRDRWRRSGFSNPFQIRMGINTGFCNVGNFGSEQRLTYTIIGGEVNVAQRLESNADPDGILISHETYAHTSDMIHAEERGVIKMKGINRDIKVYSVLGRRNLLQEKKKLPEDKIISKKMPEIDKLKFEVRDIKASIIKMQKTIDDLRNKVI